MNKSLTLFSMLAVALSAVAAPLSPDEALQRVSRDNSAKKFLKGNIASPQLIMTGRTSKGKAAYYVFTEKKGTLFVSADDQFTPLLGYSESTDVTEENMPPQLKWWLKMYADEIAYASQKTPTNKPTLRHKTAKTATRNSIAPMLNTTWDQDAPYNKYCPTYQGELTVTGCVATAMSQVMKYYAWPQETVSPISYQWNNKTLTSPSVKLDWANMLNSYAGNYTTAQADAVARLMQVAGYSVNMQYDIASNGGSGAYSDEIRNAMVDKLGYDVGMNYVFRDFYTAEEWDNIIYNNLVNYGPIVYGGDGDLGGHSFVCDGYDGSGSYHFNWGWGGLADGYFKLSALDPDDLGTGGGGGGFNYNQDAVIGISKPIPGSVAPAPYICGESSLTGSASGRTITLSVNGNGVFYNMGFTSAAFDFGACLINDENGQTTYISGDSETLDPYYGIYEYSVSLPSSLAVGTYTLRPTYRVNSGDWDYIKFVAGDNDRLTVNVTASGVTIENGNQGGGGDVTIVNMTNGGFVIGKPYNVSLTISNPGSSAVTCSYDAYLCSEDEEGYLDIEEELGYKSVTVAANSRATMNFSGTLSNTLKPGYYYLVIADDYEVVEYYDVQVTSSSSSDPDSDAVYEGLSDSCDWTFEYVTLPDELTFVWQWDSRNGYLKGSAYKSGTAYAAEAWAVSPVIDLSGLSDANVNFLHAAKFQTTLKSLCGFYVREVGGEWQKLDITYWPEAGTWNFEEAGEMSLKAYAGKQIQLGAKYGSSASGADTWEIKEVTVTGTEATVDPDPIDPDPIEDATLEVINATDIKGDFNETKYNATGGIQSYANYQPLDEFSIGGYDFMFYNSVANSTQPALYMTEDGQTPQTLRLYKYCEMEIFFPSNTVKTLTWNCKSMQGVDDVKADNGVVVVNVDTKTITWTNTEESDNVMFTMPSEKGSDNKNPNIQITSFSVTVDSPVIDPDPTPGEYFYLGLTDNCDWTFDETNIPAELTYVWKWDEAREYLKGSAYVGGIAYDAEAWAISPVIDLSLAASPYLNFEHAAKFQTTLEYLCGFYVREVGGEWNKVNIQNWPEAGTWNFVEAGEISLQPYAGKKIQLGAKYGSSTSGADTWEIKNVVIKDALTGVSQIDSVEGETIFFDLTGRRVENPTNGLYIKVVNNKASKVIVRK